MNKFLKSKTVKAALGLVAVFALVGVYSASAYNFTTVLKMGSKGEAVRELQKALNACSDTMVASTGAGSPGYETSTFAGKTKTAVMKLQAKAGLSQVGQVGPLTRAFLNANGCGTGSTGNTGNTGGTVVTGQITASVASDSPANMTLAGGSAFNPVLKLRLANGTSSPVNVTGLNLTKTGFMANTNVSGVAVYDSAAMQHGNTVSTLGANGVAVMTFPTNPITVPANGTTDVWVKINLATGATSGTVGMSVVSSSDIMLSSGTAGGTFPIAGAQMTVVSGSSSLATVTFDAAASSCGTSGCTLNVDNASSQEIAKFRIRETSSNEQVKLYGLTLWNNGNASSSDYRDVQLLDQSNNVVATAQPNGNMVKFNLSTPFLMDKGQTKDFTVRATIVGGSTRTIQFVVYNDYDLDIRGVSTGVSILPGAGSTDTAFPIGDATSYNKVTIGQGTLVFARSSDSPSSSIAPGASDVVLAKYYAKPIGEDLELRQVSFGIVDASAILSGTVYVKVNGQIVYSAAVNNSNFATAGTAATRSLSTYPILTSGQNNTIEVTASVRSSASSGSVYVNAFNTTSAKRLITNDIVTNSTLGTSAQNGLTRTLQAGALTLTNLASPTATSVVAGTNSFNVANFELNAGSSGEDIRVSSITVTDTKNSSGAYADLTNLVMKDSSGNQLTTSSSTSTNANTVAFNFSSPIIVAKTSPVTLKLYADVVGGNTGATHTFTIAATANVTATGKDTGNSITPSALSGSGQAMTITSGGTIITSVVSGTSATPTVSQIVNINSTDGVYLAWKWTSQYEAQKVTSLTVKAAGTALVQNNVKNIRLYAKKGAFTSFQSDATLFASANQFQTCSSNACVYTWTAGDNLLPFTVDPGTGVTVWVKADIEGENTAKLGNDFSMMLYGDGTTDSDSAVTGADLVAKGSVTGSAPTYSGSANTSGSANYITPFQVVVTGESPTNGSTTQSSLGSGTQIARFKVMNNGSAQVTLTNVKFTDSGSHTGSTERYTLYGSSENSNDYTGNLLQVSSTDSVDFGAIGTTITLNGGSYRYLTVTLSTAGSVATGNTFSLSIASLGDVKYSVTEANLGYDGNQSGTISGSITGLYADGKPSLGTYYK